MTDSILRNQSEIATADNARLVATYNALTGKSIKKFSGRAAAERQVEMAMLGARDNDAHTGVPKDTPPRVITVAEAAAKIAPDREDGVAFVPGSLADQLDKATHHSTPISPRARKPASSPGTARRPVVYVLVTGAGTSKVQLTSTRGEVLSAVAASRGGWAAVAALDVRFGCNTKGYLQKLIENGHLTPCDGDGKALAAPVASAAAPGGGE